MKGLPEGGGGLTPYITGISEEPGKADEMLQSRHVARQRGYVWYHGTRRPFREDLGLAFSHEQNVCLPEKQKSTEAVI